MTSPEQLGVPWRIVNATSLDLCVKVIPKSSSTKFGGCQPVDYPFRVALKIHLSAVPEDGKANAALIAFLAKTWHIAKAHITIQSGLASRIKILHFQELTLQKQEELIENLTKIL